ncbi:MAG: class I SAM-dependent methyltransferase [Deltaproteobacteria bacterium]
MSEDLSTILSETSDCQDFYSQPEIFSSIMQDTHEKQEFARTVVRKINSLIAFEKKPLHILDIGVHDGFLTLKWLQEVAPKLPAGSSVTCIEPNLEATKSFRQKTVPENVNFIFVNETTEAFLRLLSRRFDLTVASHCFYWSDNFWDMVKSLNSISDHMLIAIQDVFGIFEIRSRYESKLKRSGFNLYNSNMLQDLLKETAISFEKKSVSSDYPLFSEKDPRTRLLVSFILQTPAEEITASEIKDVYALITQKNRECFTSYGCFFELDSRV